MFFRCDGALVHRAQSGSERVQDAVGITCFGLARIGHLLAFGSVAALARYLSPEMHAIGGAVLSFATMYCFIMWSAYGEMERYYSEGPEVAHPNTLIWLEQAHVRLMNLLLIVAAVAYGLWRLDGPERSAIGYGGCLCFWAASLYLQCCIPKRPSRSALRRMVESLRDRLAARPATSPSPA